MKDLFTIQNESGQLWLDIKAQLDAKDAEHAAALAVKEAQLADQATEANLARQAATEEHAAALAAKDAAQAAAVEAAKLAIQINLDALVAAAESAFAPLVAVIDPELSAPLGAVIEQAKAYTTAARRAKLEAELAAAQAAAAAHAAALAALA